MHFFHYLLWILKKLEVFKRTTKNNFSVILMLGKKYLFHLHTKGAPCLFLRCSELSQDVRGVGWELPAQSWVHRHQGSWMPAATPRTPWQTALCGRSQFSFNSMDSTLSQNSELPLSLVLFSRLHPGPVLSICSKIPLQVLHTTNININFKFHVGFRQKMCLWKLLVNLYSS